MVRSRTARRAFGRAEDLELNFSDDDRPSLVTALLARCAEPPDAQFWWRQPVGTRIVALLQLLLMTEGSERLKLLSRCTQSRCAQPFEFELPLAALIEQPSSVEPLQIVLDGERRLSMRRATGEDLRRWRAARPRSRREAVTAMIEALRLDGAALPEDEAVLADAISAHDPLVAFTVACQCPACGAGQALPVDLEAVVLARLGARQRALLGEIHQFASHYGWTESEVLAIAPSRRMRYVALIEGER